MTPLIRVARIVLWVWRLTKAWLPQVLATAATIFSIVWGGYGSQIWLEGVWALWVAGALLVSSLLAQAALQRPSYMKLAEQRDVAQADSASKSEAIEESLTVLLRNLAEHCSMSSNADRASVYYFHNERFVMLARWSKHPDYTRPGRRDYPTGQGAIGDAWDRGSVVTVLPSTRGRWDQRLESHHGFPSGTASKLSMHCQSVAAIRIEHDHHAVGVIVFESTDPTRATQSTLDTLVDSKLYATLRELVAAVASWTPRVEAAKATAPLQPLPAPAWKSVPDRG